MIWKFYDWKILSNRSAVMGISGKLAEERRGRLAAERLLELKQEELFAANRKLGRHAQALGARPKGLADVIEF